MTTWKDGGDCGRLSRQITNEDGSRAICTVWTQQSGHGYGDEPWPEGEANFHLVLQAPRMLEALETIAKLGGWMEEKEVVCNRMEEIARAAIAAVKGEGSNETELV